MVRLRNRCVRHRSPGGRGCSGIEGDELKQHRAPPLYPIARDSRQGGSDLRSYRADHRNPQRLRYGWRLTRSGHIVVDKQQRASIFLILALRSEQATLQQICDHLSYVQSPTPRKGRWYCSTVKKIIDQNAALINLLPHALPNVQAWLPEPRRASATVCSASEKLKPASERAHQHMPPVRSCESAYAPSQRKPAGGLVHKPGLRSVTRR